MARTFGAFGAGGESMESVHIGARPRRIFLAALALFFAVVSPVAAASQEIVRLKTRGEVQQPYLLQHDDASVRVVAVLFTGGHGLLSLRQENERVVWGREGASYLTLAKDLFQDRETAIALVDVPSDQLAFGYTPRFRKSGEHAVDVGHIVRDLRSRFPAAKVFLVGTSQGTTSAAYAGRVLGKDIDGVVLTASVFEWAPASWRYLHDSNLKDFDFSAIAAPLLVVHHEDDRCVATPYSAAVKLADKLPLITVKGGLPVRDNGCGPFGPHGFLGREEPVAAEIKNWMHGRPFRKEIP